jgi:hypothetical protein
VAGAGAIGEGIARDRAAAEKALRTWGEAATRACRKSDRRLDPLDSLLKPKGKLDRAGTERLGRGWARYAEAAEYEYDLLRAIPTPAEPAAVDAIQAFFEKEEELLMLAQRIGVELKAHNDRGALLRTVRRVLRLADDYKRAARAVNASRCFD